MIKFRYELAITILWTVAILSTVWITRGTNFFSYLGPLFFICMTGSIVTVRRARCASIQSKAPGDEKI